jgi:DNA-binding CsgD family transcriptional regulator
MRISEPNSYLASALTFIQILQSEIVTKDDICQVVALSLFANNPPKGVGIFEINTNGTFSITSTFGLMDGIKENFQNVPLSLISPAATAMRENRIIFVETDEQLALEFPDTRSKVYPLALAPSVSVPIRKRGITIGALVLQGKSGSMDAESRDFLYLVATTIGSHLKPTGETKIEITIASKGVLLGLPLTKRESQVQFLMGDGKTNRQISDELGYSESTIRQDAVSMFAKLDVKNRQDAGNLLHVVK